MNIIITLYILIFSIDNPLSPCDGTIRLVGQDSIQMVADSCTVNQIIQQIIPQVGVLNYDRLITGYSVNNPNEAK